MFFKKQKQKQDIERKTEETKKEEKQTNICPVCGKKYDYAISVTYHPDGRKTCRHDKPAKKGSLLKKRHANEEASVLAIRQAAEMKAADKQVGNDEEVLVTSTQEGKDKGKTEKIPKVVIDSIEEKVKPMLEE